MFYNIYCVFISYWRRRESTTCRRARFNCNDRLRLSRNHDPKYYYLLTKIFNYLTRLQSPLMCGSTRSASRTTTFLVLFFLSRRAGVRAAQKYRSGPVSFCMRKKKLLRFGYYNIITIHLLVKTKKKKKTRRYSGPDEHEYQENPFEKTIKNKIYTFFFYVTNFSLILHSVLFCLLSFTVEKCEQ